MDTRKLFKRAARTGKFLISRPARAALKTYGKGAKPAVVALVSSDVYTLASAISTTAIFSFFPFAILIISVVRHVIRSPEAYDAIVGLMRQYVPIQQDFIIQSLEAMTDKFGTIQLLSAVILLVSAT